MSGRVAIEKLAMAGLILLVAVTARVVVGTPLAEADPVAAASLAGSYTATVVDATKKFTDRLTLSSDGHFAFKGDPEGTWKVTAGVVTLTGRGAASKGFVFTADVVGTKLGSKSDPGSMTIDGLVFAKWWAVPS